MKTPLANSENATTFTDATHQSNVPLMPLATAKAFLANTKLKDLKDEQIVELLESIRQFCIISYYHTAYDNQDPLQSNPIKPNKSQKE